MFLSKQHSHRDFRNDIDHIDNKLYLMKDLEHTYHYSDTSMD